MTYKESLDYLYSQLPMYQRQGKSAFKKDLTNISLLCEHFHDPHNGFASIHIAGTNGKGTVAHMLAAVFQEAGLRVGLYTSPHYKDFRERIKINGEYIPKRKVSRFVKLVKERVADIRPSFFEITVAMAFFYFKNEQVDLAIIETGLGGRLDSTNIITPQLSIITNISLDHQSMLGDTIREIANEKAGIIKKGVPVLIGERQVETTKIFEEAAIEKNAKIYFADDLDNGIGVEEGQKLIPNPYEAINSKTVRAAVAIWNKEKLGIRIGESMVNTALKSYKSTTNYIGRWEILNERPLIIADSAHNESGISILVNQLLKSYKPHNMHFVIGFVKDKPLNKVLSLFPTQSTYYFCHAKIARALPSQDLQRSASNYNLKGKTYASVKEAVSAAQSLAHKDNIVIICGSIFVIGELT